MARFGLMLPALVALLLGLTAGRATAFPAWEEPERTVASEWSLVSIDGPHEITYVVSAGYCVGKPKPQIDHVKVVWHARSAVITVFVHYPAVHFGKNEACGGVGLSIEGPLRLAHSISKRALYDGSTSPPKRRARRTRR